MVYTISPLVEEAKRFRFYLAASLHILGGLIGGALLGGAFGVLGWFLLAKLSTWPVLLVATGLTMLYALREFGLLPLPIWNLKDVAVPYGWRLRFGQVGAAPLYGLGLGMGFSAATPYGSFHFMLLWLFVLANWQVGALVGALYGFARTVQPLFWGVLWPSLDRQLQKADWLRANTKLVHRVNGLSLLAAGLAGLTTWLAGR